ncbi:MAG TPA: hypothetical protein DDY31_05885 [Lachnospiraceae bacterium]|nr:hypothetical protein [Lachnospiraceae bacterium]
MDSETRAFFQQIIGRFDQIDGRLDKIEQRLDTLEQRMDKLEQRMDALEYRMDLMEVKQDRLKDQLEELQLSQKTFERTATKKFTSLQDGIDAIEEILKINRIIPAAVVN